jgi:hypothetical protein
MDRNEIEAIKSLADGIGVNLANPAALHAFMSGDIENAVVASTPGGIRAQEAAGQRALVTGDYLPKKDLPRPQLEQLGFVFGQDKDDLFINVQFPAGWRKEATDHNMWSKLVDHQGRERAMMFYKAAFYDRSAFMGSLKCRYQASEECGEFPATEDYDSHYNYYRVLDNVTGETLFHTDNILNYKSAKVTGLPFDWEKNDREKKAALEQVKNWLAEHYPDYENPLAYW